MKRFTFTISKSTLLSLLVLPICVILSAFNLFRSPAWSYDVIEYQSTYELINNTSISGSLGFLKLSIEPAFVFLSLATIHVTERVNLILFLLALSSLLIKLVYIPKVYFKKPFILVVVYALTYYILLELTQSRVAIASGIILLGYHFLIIRKRKLFALSIIAATLFHYTAIISIIALFFSSDADDESSIKRHLAILISLFVISTLLKTTVVFSIIEFIDAKKASYLSATDEDLGTGISRIIFVVLYQILILFLCRPAMLRSNEMPILRFHKLLFNLYAVSISIYLSLHSFGVIAIRLAEVFRNLEPFLLVLTLSNCRNNKKIVLALLIILSIFVNLQKNNYMVHPLNSIFKAVNLTEKTF